MKRKIIMVFAGLVFLAAMGITLYPLISSYVNEKYRSEIHTQYTEKIECTDDTALLEARTKAETYNSSITPGTMHAEAYTQAAIQEAANGYEELLNLSGDGIMGYVEIPKISVQLPIYHGTGSDSLERGVGHLLGSSLPIGGSGTHTILTGHSGMASQKMFTDLVQMEMSDVFYLHVLDETLAYQVDSINTVLPYDTSLLRITPDEDLCTLVTCTPYGINTHRLLVRGSRIPYEEAEVLEEKIWQEELPASSWEQQYVNGVLWGFLALVPLSLIVCIMVAVRRKRHG